MQDLTINTNINFGGFYESIHSYVIDTYVEDYEYDFENVDYRATYEIYVKDYIKVLNNILDTNISFKALNSPKFYNYSTDVINIDISKKDILKLFQYVRNEELKQEIFNVIKKSSTSRDGYIAFHNYEDFFKKENLDILIECMLDIIVDNLQEDIVEEIQANYLEIVFNDDN